MEFDVCITNRRLAHEGTQYRLLIRELHGVSGHTVSLSLQRRIDKNLGASGTLFNVKSSGQLKHCRRLSLQHGKQEVFQRQHVQRVSLYGIRVHPEYHGVGTNNDTEQRLSG